MYKYSLYSKVNISCLQIKTLPSEVQSFREVDPGRDTLFFGHLVHSTAPGSLYRLDGHVTHPVADI